ncbi:MAG: M36 family metallopeptidase [Deltaproteobacteria bacterium]|nr:M36 family metallopeptidase [Deltaproteobacteria bacterium]
MKRELAVAAAVGLLLVTSCAQEDGVEVPPQPVLASAGKADGARASDGRDWRVRRDRVGVARKVRIAEAEAEDALAPAPAAWRPTTAPEAVARAFLRSNAAFLALPPGLDDLATVSVNAEVVDLEQRLDERPLRGAGVRVALDHGRVVMVHNRRFAVAPARWPAGTLTDDDARRRLGISTSAEVRQAWQIGAGERPVAVLWASDGAQRGAIDALSGRLLWQDRVDRAVVDARGRVYRENAWRDPVPVEVQLSGLRVDGTLRGAHVQVRGAVPVNGRATAYRFDFEAGSAGFAQVMAYYHVDRMARWLGRLGLHPRRKAVRIEAQAFADLNAYFDPIADVIRVGAFGGTDVAEDADVLIHEYGHAVLQAYQPDMLGPAVGSHDAALHEGFADWLACVAYGDPLQGETLHQALARTHLADQYLTDIGFEPRAPGRRCDAARRLPGDDHFDPHVAGMIVSGALWDLRAALIGELGDDAGTDLALRLTVAALRHLERQGNDLTDLLEAVLEADRRARGGRASTILTAFARHGIVPRPADPHPHPTWL